MALEALPNSNELYNFVIYETISATPCSFQGSSATTANWLCNENNDSCTTNSSKPHHDDQQALGALESSLLVRRKSEMGAEEGGEDGELCSGGGAIRCDDDYGDNKEEEQGHGLGDRMMMMMRRQPTLGVVVRKKRKRKPRVCKNKEEAETQRMTHIAVERNRRKQMNEHLAVLRSLMPDSYVQRGDQASIVGGAIEFVKELEHLLQSLEAQKLQVLQGMNNNGELVDDDDHRGHNKKSCNIDGGSSKFEVQPPFAQFFLYPQYTWSQISNKYTSKTKAAIADIEVTLIETHASLRIFTRRSPRQLSRLISGFQSLNLTVLHLNVTTLNPLVLYSVSVKVEEVCLLTSVDDIAAAVHHMLRIIEDEAAMPVCC